MVCSGINLALWLPGTAAYTSERRVMDRRGIIAIVDDDAAVRTAVSMLVRAFGWEPRAYDSAEAFLDAREEGADCLVVDLRMPGMSGVDLQRELTSRGSTVPMLMVTAHGDGPLADAARKAGALVVLGKPFREQELRYWIERAVEARD